jgi:histidinol-phosphate aminotransferase
MKAAVERTWQTGSGLVSDTSVVRLDQVNYPYGVCPAALEALASPIDCSEETLARQLRDRLAATHRLPVERIVLLRDIDGAIHNIINLTQGQIVTFPPSSLASKIEADWRSRSTLVLARGPREDATLDLDLTVDLPGSGTAISESPSDPIGSLLRAADAVRLARSSGVVVVDERYSEFAGFSLLPLATEFDNLVILRSLSTWSGLYGGLGAWAVIAPRMAERFSLGDEAFHKADLSAALALFANLGGVNATLRLVRDERSRLYRLARKLSFLEPLNSWGPFLSARVHLVEREVVVDGLARHGVLVHPVETPGLERFIRFGIGTRTSMERLRTALIDLAPEILSLGISEVAEPPQ